MTPLFRRCLVLLFALTAAAQDWEQLNHRLDAAYKANDYSSAHGVLLQFYEGLHGHPSVVLRLAAADAHLGREQDALKWLRLYARMGVTADLSADQDFAGLRGHEAFDAFAADIEANGRRVVSNAALVRELPENRFIAEDIAYDSVDRAFYVTSVRRRKIVRLGADGKAVDFIGPGPDGWAMMAIGIDSARRLLWVTTSTLEEATGYHAEQAGRSALLRFDLTSGEQTGRYEPAADGREHTLGDMTVGPSGDVFISDSHGAVYMLPQRASALKQIVAPGVFRSAQGPALEAAGRRLFVSDYLRGIAIVDLRNFGVSWLLHPEDITVHGIDGLYFDGDALIGIQNGIRPERVARFVLSRSHDRVLRCEVVEQNSALLGEPTHGVFVDGTFHFIGRSGWERVDDEKAPVILRVGAKGSKR